MTQQLSACLERGEARVGGQRLEVSGKACKMSPHLWGSQWGFFSQLLVTATSKPLSWNVPSAWSPFTFPADFTSHKAYSWLYLCSHQPLARGPWKLFPRGEHSEWCGCPWLTSHPWSILSLQGPGQAAPACTYQHGSQRGYGLVQLWTVTCYRENKDPFPHLSRSPLGTGPAHSMFSGSFQTCLFQWLLLRWFISLGSWPQNTLFVVNCKTGYPLKLLKKKKKKALVLLEIFLVGKPLPAPLRDALTHGLDWLEGPGQAPQGRSSQPRCWDNFQTLFRFLPPLREFMD